MAGERRLELPVLHGRRLTLRPLTEAHLDRLVVVMSHPSVRRWWGTIEGPQALREDLRHDGCAFAIEVGDAVAGWLGVCEEDEPDYRHAALDIALGPDQQDRGLGSEALRTVIHWLIDARGHHRFTIDPAVANRRAVRAYAAVGFRPVGVLRRYERGPDGTWQDGLLMDLLAEELVDAPRERADG
ncbi:MAG TPA: GNAT family protein [Conexibacter sp.]|nr:GNAT family protein [Conexibacter sp.]